MLESRLKEFHKFDNLEIQLPAKQRNIFKNSQNLEFFRSIKNEFAKYLQVCDAAALVCANNLMELKSGS